MALHRGIQSAIFYYLSCAPCAEARYRKKRKEEAQRDRLEREALEADLPNLYRHPSPSSTNPHWQTEIALGPALESRARKKPSRSDSQRGTRRAGTLSSNTRSVASSDDLSRRADSSDCYDGKRNFRPFQREDEELWGSSVNLNGSYSGNSIRRPATARTKDSTRSDFQSFRNPPINDMHPATVTKIASREDVMWMLQPPPVAEVMSGKQRAGRSRSNSGTSRPGSNHPSLMRQNSSAFDLQRLRAFSGASSGLSRESSTRTATPLEQGKQRHCASTNISERDFASTENLPEPHARQRPSPLLLPHQPGSASSIIPQQQPLLHPEAALKRPIAAAPATRPPLSTVVSNDSVLTVDDADTEFHTPAQTPQEQSAMFPARSSHGRTDAEAQPTAAAVAVAPATSSASPRNHLVQRSAILVHEDSLKLMQDLHPGAGVMLNSKILTAATQPPSPSRSAFGHSADNSISNSITPSTGSARQDLLDSLYTPDFALPDWVHEHTKREVQQRWSMDL